MKLVLAYLPPERDSRDQLTDFTPAVRLEAVVADDQVEAVVEVIYEAAHTGSRGDGKVYVLPEGEP